MNTSKYVKKKKAQNDLWMTADLAGKFFVILFWPTLMDKFGSSNYQLGEV